MESSFSELNIIQEQEEEDFMMSTMLGSADEGRLEDIEDLLRDVPDINIDIHNKHLETALHFASGAGHLDVVLFLISRGSNVNCKDKHDDTPLYWACRQGHLKVVESLVANNADIHAKNKTGQTCLHVAVRYQRVEIIKYLCQVGVDVNAQDQNGETCMHVAAGRGSLDCLKCLLKYGADINILDKRKSTALHLSCHCQHVSIVKELVAHGNCRLDAADQNGDAAIHIACHAAILPLVQLLSANGCNVDLVNKSGLTPLHIASKQGNTEIVRCLLLAGANVDIRNKSNITAQMIALARGKNNISDLLTKITPDKQDAFIKQLLPSSVSLPRIKLKIFGNSGVGKTLLINSLKCGFFGSLFKKAVPGGATSTNIQQQQHLHHHQQLQQSLSLDQHVQLNSTLVKKKLSIPLSIFHLPMHEHYTKGIDVQTSSLSGGVGEMSMWEFSGYESYFQFYDIFIGDVNCVHLVCFNAFQPYQQQVQQINFWLNFIKSRIPPSDVIGTEGKLPIRAKVILVGIMLKADIPSSQQSPTNYDEESDFYKQLQNFYLTMKVAYKPDLEIHPQVFLIDPSYPMSSQMKGLRSCIAHLKGHICKTLPPGGGFLDATIQSLPAWRRVLAGYPVVSWSNFVHYIRSTVNLLASEEHLKELIYKLQVMGEVTFVETDNSDEEDSVVLNIKWLCADVLGKLLSSDITTTCRPTGCFGLEDFQLLFPDYEAAELLQLLQHLGLCTRCELGDDDDIGYKCNFEHKNKLNQKNQTTTGHRSVSDGKEIVEEIEEDYYAVEYELPCLNFLETLNGLWDRNDPHQAVNTVYGGCRYILFCQFCHSFKLNAVSGSNSSTPSLERNCSLHHTRVHRSLSGSVGESSLGSMHVTFSTTSSLSPQRPTSILLPVQRLPSLDDGGLCCRNNNQFGHLFTRLQMNLRRHYMRERNQFDVDLYQWFRGSKYCKGDLEVMITFENKHCVYCQAGSLPNTLSNQTGGFVSTGSCFCCQGAVEIKCRGPSDMAEQLFEFSESIKRVFRRTIGMCCPSLDYRVEVLSSSHLSDHRLYVKSFTQREILEAYQTSGIDGVVCFQENDESESVESLLDLIAFGSSEVGDCLVFGTDLQVSTLLINVKRKLAACLDPSHHNGCDWCMLAILLGLSDKLPIFDTMTDQVGNVPVSKTCRILTLWSGMEFTNVANTSIKILVDRLTELGRPDAVDILLNLGIMYRKVHIDQNEIGKVEDKFEGGPILSSENDDVSEEKSDHEENANNEEERLKSNSSSPRVSEKVDQEIMADRAELDMNCYDDQIDDDINFFDDDINVSYRDDDYSQSYSNAVKPLPLSSEGIYLEDEEDENKESNDFSNNCVAEYDNVTNNNVDSVGGTNKVNGLKNDLILDDLKHYSSQLHASVSLTTKPEIS